MKYSFLSILNRIAHGACRSSRARAANALLIATLCSANAMADTVIDEIQVTATRRSSSIADVSTPVTVIGEAVVDASPLLTDALAFSPGVLLQETTPGQGAAIVRGLKGSEVLHLVDGIRLNNAIFRSAPTQYLALVPGASVQRVEVLRGSAAGLYGSDAVGGVVNIVTRQPEFSDSGITTSGDVSLSANSAEALRAIAMTLELSGEQTAGLLAFDAMRTSDRRIGGGDRIDSSGFSAFGARAMIRKELTSAANWFADLQIMRQPSTPRVDELNPGFGEVEAASAEFFFEPNQRTFMHAGVNIDSGWLDADWQMRMAWQRIDDDRRTRNTGSDIRTLEANRSDLMHVGVTGSRVFEQGSWVAGAEYYYDAVDSARTTFDIVTGATQSESPRFPDGSSLKQAAVFGKAEWLPQPNQTFSAGVRFTDLTADTNSPDAPTLGNADVSGELGWLLRINDAVTLATNVGRSFRAPNIFDLGVSGVRPGNRFNVPNADLQPENAVQYDLGLRYRAARLALNATAFKLDYTDRIASVPTGEQTADGRDIVRNENIARAQIVGLELDGRYQFNERAALTVVLNVIRGTEFNPEREPGDRIPPVNGVATVEWQAQANTRVSTRVRFAAQQDRLSSRDISDARIDPQGTPGWVTLDVGVQHDINDRWAIDAQLENILDKRYRVHGSGVDASGVNLSLQLHRNW